jgi:hypothetical protein
MLNDWGAVGPVISFLPPARQPDAPVPTLGGLTMFILLAACFLILGVMRSVRDRRMRHAAA